MFVFPEVDDSIEIAINPADVRTDTYRASGAGGQHINKTDSAVRLTHVPTGIVVQCQNDRSQHRNRDEAWQMLRARLYEFELRKQQAEQQKLEDAKSDIGWGHQIRSYVLDQSRIKDLRTNHETGNTQAVLDGDLDGIHRGQPEAGRLRLATRQPDEASPQMAGGCTTRTAASCWQPAVCFVAALDTKPLVERSDTISPAGDCNQARWQLLYQARSSTPGFSKAKPVDCSPSRSTLIDEGINYVAGQSRICTDARRFLYCSEGSGRVPYQPAASRYGQANTIST